MLSDCVIETIDLSKYYNQTKGIENLNLKISRGSIYGFLGPNGAGKSTTIRLILNLLRPTHGLVKIFGMEIKKNYYKIFRELGNVPGELKLYEQLNGEYFLKYINSFTNKKPVLQKELLNAFKLSNVDLKKKIKYYSHGMKQKLIIIQAMQENPDLLIMDEPSEGLDPINKSILYNYIQKFKKAGKTVFLSSHYLAEVEKICDSVGLVRDGELIAEDSMESLKKKMVRKMQIFFTEKFDALDFQIEGIKIIEQSEKKLLLHVTGDLNPIINKLTKYKIKNLVFPDPTLEDTFLTYYA